MSGICASITSEAFTFNGFGQENGVNPHLRTKKNPFMCWNFCAFACAAVYGNSVTVSASSTLSGLSA